MLLISEILMSFAFFALGFETCIILTVLSDIRKEYKRSDRKAKYTSARSK